MASSRASTSKVLLRSLSSSSAARPLSDIHPASPSPSPNSQRTQYGQPLPSSHPHLFPAYDTALPFPSLFPQRSLTPSHDYHHSLRGDAASSQLTPGITRAEYEARRRNLVDAIPDGSVVLVMGGRVKYMSGAIFYRFRQASNFFYLTGFNEPDAALVLEKRASTPRGFKMTMFVPPREAGYEAWNGPRTGTDGAVDVFGADEAIDIDGDGRSLLEYLKATLPGASTIYYDPPLCPTIPRKTSKLTSSNATTSQNLLNYLSPPSPSALDIFSKKTDFDAVVKLLAKAHDLAPLLDSHRLIKSPSELRLMRRAGQIAGLAHNSTMRFSQSPSAGSEAALEAHFEYTSSLLGAQRPAYVPVVAAGSRGCTIHYTSNDHPAPQGSLVTIDAGVEHAGYTSDITRAWPTSGHFTEPQRDLYSALLSVLKQCTALAVANNGYSLASLHRRSVELLRVELRQLGFDLALGELERCFYAHYLGHFLGLDLHDTPTVSRGTTLKEGMVITVEPGLYIPEDTTGLRSVVPRAFRGIGIRVEDDVAVGRGENVVLSAEAVKEVKDVEAVLQGWGGEEVERMVSAGQAGLGFDRGVETRQSV
ncbi:hypothetical protein BDZ90DRAFT_234134 [Jaminaea rosea]|uniref:Aminopeptidase P N-terminal domain-containing protein n=1 Tax=Jaminaea rosea TaxID=1569628 RepID=A0A316UKG3_9BASI|nr:hypothetical protein BDZ90DRAFT_234134 [Jaminaea rosea]PWN25288.1 hypothetical protein BDZ90DRAFT_234134 [Jaminaea rosea]